MKQLTKINTDFRKHFFQERLKIKWTWINTRCKFTTQNLLNNTHTQQQILQVFKADLETSKHLVQNQTLAFFGQLVHWSQLSLCFRCRPAEVWSSTFYLILVFLDQRASISSTFFLLSVYISLRNSIISIWSIGLSWGSLCWHMSSIMFCVVNI